MSRLQHQKFLMIVLTIVCFGVTSCRTTSQSSRQKDQSIARQPDTLPSLATDNAWGGNDTGRWKPEAIYANGLSDFMNRLWKTPAARDVLISMPVTFMDSGVRPYPDLQSNARVSFSTAWSKKTVPVRAGFVRKSSEPSVVILEFSPDLNLSQNSVEIHYRDQQNITKQMVLNGSKNAAGWLSVEWNTLPTSIGLDSTDITPEADELSGLNFTFFVRPSPAFNDWFPITFKHPWTTIEKITRTVPEGKRSFAEHSGVPAPNNLTDPMNFAQKNAADPIAFDLAYDMGKRRQWPKSFAPQDRDYYPSCNVHGAFTQDNNPHDPTAVGRNWTWVADPGDDNTNRTAPFKILYTCFEERRLKRPTGNDPDCNGIARNSEEDEGVPSGGGWHKIGDPAETLFNSLELVPLLVAAGFERPSERTGQMPPSGTYAYGLKDVAVARWLWPGEAFLTANSDKDSSGNEAKNYHWFLFHADRETCTLEWVHPQRPDDSRMPRF